MTSDHVKSFAEEWILSWNCRDVETILNHYAEDVIIESRIAAKLILPGNGVIVGKMAVRKYWEIGLELNRNLKFELLDVLYGINGLSIYYENVANSVRAVEIMIFNDEGKVQKAYVHHSN